MSKYRTLGKTLKTLPVNFKSSGPYFCVLLDTRTVRAQYSAEMFSLDCLGLWSEKECSGQFLCDRLLIAKQENASIEQLNLLIGPDDLYYEMGTTAVAVTVHFLSTTDVETD